LTSQNKTSMQHATDEDSLLSDYDPKVPAREQIMRHLRSSEGPVHPDDLAKALDAGDSVSIGLDRRLAAMERDGQLFINPQGLLILNAQADFIAGRVQGHRDGFGFLLRDDGEPDLFLPPGEMRKVLHGDKVLARITQKQDGRAEASIVEVVERKTNRLVGRFVKDHGGRIVLPEDQRIKHDILITAADAGGAKNGQVVVAEILQQPTRYTQPMGRIVEVLGEIDDPGMEIEIAVRKFDVPHEFSKAALKQADRIPATVQEDELVGRVDLREVPFITIDGEDARDFDDAVYCTPANIGTEKRRRKGWRLLVAIADVSHYVKPGSAIDRDALERGTSVYFPRRVIPMLPEALSTGICSLNPNEERLVMVCDMAIPATGKQAGTVTAYQFYPAVIRSRERTTYESVWASLQHPQGPEAQRYQHILEQIQHGHELFQLFDERRKQRGAMEFDTIETRIVTNDMGKIEAIEPALRNDVHRLIEEFMLAANTCAADFMRRRKRMGLFRVHEGPTPKKLTELREFLRVQGLNLGGGDDPSPQDYAELLDSARNRPDFQVIQLMCLRSMQQAIYSPEESGHFGLAYEHYTHFTSPIRRYPDLLIHRVIKGVLAGKRYIPKQVETSHEASLPRKEREFANWEKLGIMLSGYERRAEDASRDVESWLKCWFVREHIGEVFSGQITGVAPFGLFITLDSLYVEGMVHVSELGLDYFQYSNTSHELVGERTGIRYRLTDRLQVQVARVDLEARRIDFRLVKGTGYQDLKTAADRPKRRKIKRAASTKPAALRGTTAKQRRALAKRQARASSAARRPTKRSKKRR